MSKKLYKRLFLFLLLFSASVFSLFGSENEKQMTISEKQLTELEQDLTIAETELSQAQTELNQLKIELKESENTLTTVNKLLDEQSKDLKRLNNQTKELKIGSIITICFAVGFGVVLGYIVRGT